MKKFNLSTILAVAGGIGIFAPDLASVSALLAGTGIPKLALAAKVFGWCATLAASLPRIVPKFRQVLAAANLATAPGAAAPVPAVAAPVQAGGDAPGKVLPISVDPPAGGAALVVLLALSLALTACKTAGPAPDSFAGRVVTCTEANTQNLVAGQAVYQCLSDVAVGAYVGCLAGLPAAGGWSYAEVACIVRSYAQPRARAMLAAQPVADPAREHAAAWLASQRISFRP